MAARNPNLPVEENASNTNSNNGASIASSVSFRTGATNESEGDWNHEEGWNNWSENEATPTPPPAAPATIFSVSHSSDFFQTPGAYQQFNDVARELIAAHPEFRLARVGGNPNAYGAEGGNGYVYWVEAIPGVTPPELFAAWPAFIAAMEERLPGVNLPTDLQSHVGWQPPAPITNYMRRALNRQGGRGRYRKSQRRRKYHRTLKSRRKTKRRRT